MQSSRTSTPVEEIGAPQSCRSRCHSCLANLRHIDVAGFDVTWQADAAGTEHLHLDEYRFDCRSPFEQCECDVDKFSKFLDMLMELN